MKTSDFADIVAAKISHVAHPKQYPVEQIEACHAFELGQREVRNPFWKEGEKTARQFISSETLFEELLAQGWQVSMIGWKRDDGSTNYGQPPSVQHKLVAVMVKLRQEKKE